MTPTFVMAAALAVGGYDPVGDVPLHNVPGPAFQIPCKVQAADLITHVQLWVSADRGKTWQLYEEITPDKSAFTFVAKKAGEYWFAPRIKKKDGSFTPVDRADLIATQRVAVTSGFDGDTTLPPPLPAAKPTLAEAAAELDEELTRVELDLIRKEIKKLSEMKELTPEAADKFDRLRFRLRDLRDRLRPDRDRSPTLAPGSPPGAYAIPEPIPSVRSGPLPPPSVVPEMWRPAPDEGRIPPSTVPTDPLIVPMQKPVTPAPARPVAPPPRAPGRSS